MIGTESAIDIATLSLGGKGKKVVLVKLPQGRLVHFHTRTEKVYFHTGMLVLITCLVRVSVYGQTLDSNVVQANISLLDRQKDNS